MSREDLRTLTHKIEDHTQSLPQYQASQHLKRLLSMKVTNELMANVHSTEFIFLKLVKAGHIIVVASEANGGKTTIFVHAAAEMRKLGYDVCYINMDSALSDLEQYQRHADQHGYSLIAPDLHEGKSSDDVLKFFEEAAADLGNYSKVVVVVDTIKKLVNVLQKAEQKKIFKIFRRLTAKGMTIILLGHTNKYNNTEGKPIYEGTGDTRNDVDELIYLIPIKNQDGSMTVSAVVDKDRAGAANVTFTISTDRAVSVAPKYVNTLEIAQEVRLRQEDKEIIDFISKEIDPDCKNVTQLHEASKSDGLHYSRSTLDIVLQRYARGNASKPLWEGVKGMKNAKFYSLLR